MVSAHRSGFGGHGDDAHAGDGAASAEFDLSIFDQGELWVARSGREFVIADLLEEEVVELVEYLQAHANHFYVQCVRRDVVLALVRSLGVPDRDSGADGAVAAEERGGRDAVGEHGLAGSGVWREMMRVTPGEWLLRTPLMIALRGRVALAGDLSAVADPDQFRHATPPPE